MRPAGAELTRPPIFQAARRAPVCLGSCARGAEYAVPGGLKNVVSGGVHAARSLRHRLRAQPPSCAPCVSNPTQHRCSTVASSVAIFSRLGFLGHPGFLSRITMHDFMRATGHNSFYYISPIVQPISVDMKISGSALYTAGTPALLRHDSVRPLCFVDIAPSAPH